MMYLVVTVALVLEVIKESCSRVGVAPAVVGRVVVRAVVDTVLYLKRAGSGLEGLKEVSECPAVLDIFDSLGKLFVLIGPFLHALTSNINYYTHSPPSQRQHPKLQPIYSILKTIRLTNLPTLSLSEKVFYGILAFLGCHPKGLTVTLRSRVCCAGAVAVGSIIKIIRNAKRTTKRSTKV